MVRGVGRRVLTRYTSAGVRCWSASWTHVIESRQPVIAGALLCNQILRGAVFEVKAHIDVHALVRSIVGRASGPASHDADPERYPPG
jgi:hypothetical protein